MVIFHSYVIHYQRVTLPPLSPSSRFEVQSLQGDELHFRLPSGAMGHELYSLVRERMPCKAGAKVGVSLIFLCEFWRVFHWDLGWFLVECSWDLVAFGCIWWNLWTGLHGL
jgi:hypothetical protein